MCFSVISKAKHKTTYFMSAQIKETLCISFKLPKKGLTVTAGN